MKKRDFFENGENYPIYWGSWSEIILERIKPY